MGTARGTRGNTELDPALPSRSLRTALFSSEDLNKWNRGRSKVLQKELEASASGVAGDCAEKTGFVARTRTPVLDSTSSSAWEQLPEVQFFTDGDIYQAHTVAFEDITISFDGTQYMVDDKYLIALLCQKNA